MCRIVHCVVQPVMMLWDVFTYRPLCGPAVLLSITPSGCAAAPAKSPQLIIGQVTWKNEGDKGAKSRQSPVANALVYLSKTSLIPVSKDLKPVTATVKGASFDPEHICLVVGQKLLIKPDKSSQHALSFTTEKNGSGSTLLPPETGDIVKKFLKAEQGILVRCAINPKFQGMITVIPNEYYCLTKQDGTFSFPVTLPPGTYTFIAYHPMYGSSSRKIDVHNGRDISMRFCLKKGGK